MNSSNKNKQENRRQFRTIGTATVIALAAALFAATAGSAFAADVAINATTSPSGFKHPGIGVSADSLANARDKVRAGVEPWRSYYDAMAKTGYASKTLLSRNRSGTLDMPGLNYYKSTATENRLIEDSWGAYTQAIMYYITGDNVYRANAMKIIRIWSNMDPTQYQYFPDAHIHSGIPLYRLMSAAEILRYTSADPAYTAYNLAWLDSDTTKLTTNLINPMLATFLYNNEHYMNQHTYPLGGAMASYIFTDNRERYAEAVEWFTVNSTSTRQNINGALAPIFPLIDAADPLNKFGYSFVQHQEMSRDQAHSGGDVDTLTGLARMVNVQGTKVDPFTGIPSSLTDAVTPYRFFGDRLLAGANAYARYMLGYATPFVDLTGGSAKISGAYRGRLSDVTELREIYTMYKYVEGVDVENEARYLAQASQQANGPMFYRAGGLGNYWGGIDTGPEFWLSFPSALAGQAPPPVGDMNIQVEQKGISPDASLNIKTEDNRSYVQLDASATGSTVAVHDIWYQDRSKYCPVGLMVRTNASSTMEIAANDDTPAFLTMTVPNTHGQWRYITYDMDSHLIPYNKGGAYLAYYKVLGNPGATVDFDYVNFMAPTQLTPPRFAQGQKTAIATVKEAALSLSLAATDANPAETVSYEAEGLPEGAKLDAATGAFTWTPSKHQIGVHKFFIVATDGLVDSVLNVSIDVENNREQAFRAALEGYDKKDVYTTKSLTPFLAMVDQIQNKIHTATDADFIANLVKLQGGIRLLELLNPVIADGSLDYGSMATSNLKTQDNVKNLVDGDYNTTTGDLKAPFYLDFGPDYLVSAGAFGLQARYNFANRSQGANVYGSTDLVNWTLLTQTETTDTSGSDFAIETIPTIAGLETQKFRYFKVQVDHPGPATDPAYPGLSSFGEFHIHGVRSEVPPPAPAPVH